MQTVSIDRLVGRTLGDYQVERLLGRGKLSAVYMARQRSQNRTVMITMFLRPETLSALAIERFNARFFQEGTLLVKLNHPNILPIYDFGVQSGSPYLVTPFVKGGSLAQVLRHQPRFTPEYALNLIKQIAAGLDHAHSRGIVHGLLNPANILMSNEQSVQVTGFGLKKILQLQGIEESHHPQAHLFSIAGTFLGSPEYIAPECVQGMPVDARADVYSLGVMFFELVSGKLPFTGTEPLEIAMQRLQQPVPSVHALCPDVPAAFDLLFYQALERDPGERFKYAGEVARAYERMLKLLDSAATAPVGLPAQATLHSQITLPPTVNWFDEEIVPSRKWQLKPPVVTGHLPAMPASSTESSAAPSAPAGEMRAWQYEPPVTGHSEVARRATALDQSPGAASINPPAAATDPFAWWSATSAATTDQVPGTFVRNAPKRPVAYSANTQRKASIKGRRQVVLGLIAGGGVVGILGIGGISFAHFIESMKQSSNTALTTTSPAHEAKPAATHATPRTRTASKTPRPQPTPQPTRPPQPTPTQSTHTGTVIGSANMPVNTSQGFTNPADGNSSVLIRLPNGNFVACERACTHEGVNVNYDPGIQRLVCPAHGAIFNPANNFSVVQGPAQTPLTGVTIHVNADGTITTG